MRQFQIKTHGDAVNMSIVQFPFRLCEKCYVEKSDSRYNLFVSKNLKQDVLKERLAKLDIHVEKREGLSDTICKSCWRDIEKLEKSAARKSIWKENLKRQGQEKNSFAKRFLSPASSKTPEGSHDRKRAKQNLEGSDDPRFNLSEYVVLETPSLGAVNSTRVSKKVYILVQY